MSKTGRHHGFTLFEMIVVVALVGLIAAMLVTQTGAMDVPNLRNASRILKADLQYASERAITTGLVHRWVVDFDRQVFRLEQLVEEDAKEVGGLPTHSDLLDLAAPLPSSEFVPVGNKFGSWRWLKESRVDIDELRVGDEEWRAGEASIAFAPDGAADPADLWIRTEGGGSMQLRIIGFTGEVRVDENPDEL